jgi:hypothetical protein
MDQRWWWLLGILGPFGAMALIRGAADLCNNWKREQRESQFGMAPYEQVLALEEFFETFFPAVLELSFYDCIITDESSLQDFTSEEEETNLLRARIRNIYGIDVTDLPDDRLVTIANAIASARRQNQLP